MNRAVTAATVVALALTAAACSNTTVDLDATPADGSAVSAAEAIVITGTAAELLPTMADQMSQLSFQIADEGDEKATLATIDSIWISIRPEVESDRPELVSGIDTTVDMARTAVVRIRPADADKAFQLLSGFVDNFNGNS